MNSELAFGQPLKQKKPSLSPTFLSCEEKESMDFCKMNEQRTDLRPAMFVSTPPCPHPFCFVERESIGAYKMIGTRRSVLNKWLAEGLFVVQSLCRSPCFLASSQDKRWGQGWFECMSACKNIKKQTMKQTMCS